MQTDDAKDDEVVITGIGRTEPGNPVALSKHTAKEEFAAFGKGKWNVDLATYAALNAQDLHSGYLNQLYTSHDYEAGLVNMMKEKFEVTFMYYFLLGYFNLVNSPPRAGLESSFKPGLANINPNNSELADVAPKGRFNLV